MTVSNGESGRSISAELVVTLLITAAYVVFVLSLPAWPSQDGPVHLYYTHVLGQLLSDPASIYHRFYFIKHIAPPYALYYYLLLLLSKLVPLALADRLVICLYIVLFVFGFRSLARAIGSEDSRAPERATLFATLLVLNWSLGMGFVNYCLSLALSFWALGLWFRLSKRSGLGSCVAFWLLTVAVTLAHPVPLLFVLGITALDLVARRTPFTRDTDRSWFADLALWVVSLLPLGYVKAFTQAHPLAQRTAVAGSLPHRALQHWIGYVQGRSLSLLFGSSLGVVVYRAALPLLLVVTLTFAVRQRMKGSAYNSAAQLFLLSSLFLLLVLPWLPSDLSGAYFFTERLTVLIWITALLACVGPSAPLPSARARRSAGNALLGVESALIVVTVCFFLSANAALRPFAERSLTWQVSNIVGPGEVVLSLEGEPLSPNLRSIPSWNPYYWMAVQIVNANGAVLANAPWLDSAIIPLAATPALPGMGLTPQLANSPHALTDELKVSGRYGSLMSGSQAILLSPSLSTSPEVPASLQQQGKSWSCVPESDQGLAICRPATRP